MSAAILSSLSTAALLAVLAKLMCEMFVGGTSISIVDFMVVSVIGAILSSIVVLVLTVTTPVCPGVRLYGLPVGTNGAGTVAVPLNVPPPVLTTVNDSELVSPMVTDPKSRLAGLTVNSGGKSVPTM